MMERTVSPYVEKRIQRKRSDFRVEFMRSSGKGGQNVNKVESACRITDIKTGLAVKAQDTRDQLKNKHLAFQRLVDKLIAFYEEEERESIQKTLVIERAVRSYKVKGNTVIDHRTGKSYNLNQVMDGRLDDILRDCREALQDVGKTQ